MDIHLCDLSKDLCDAWSEAFDGIDPNRDRILVHNGDFRDLEPAMQRWSGIVSPANSFGFMNGGIDGAYTRHFGQGMQLQLQQIIRDSHGGELLVGQATHLRIVRDYRAPGFDYLISAPTMRVPLVAKGTPNAYLATRASLRMCSSVGLSSVLFPGMGTGAGLMPPDECAAAMRRAYDHVRGPVGLQFPGSLTAATLSHGLDCGVIKKATTNQ